MQRLHVKHATLIRLICALALMMVGFAHKPLAPMPLKVQFAAYILPNGELPVLCLNDTATQPEKGVLHDRGCDACRLTNAILVPEPPSVETLTIAFAGEVVRLERQYFLTRAPYPPSSGPRAPPAGSMFI